MKKSKNRFFLFLKWVKNIGINNLNYYWCLKAPNIKRPSSICLKAFPNSVARKGVEPLTSGL